MIEGALPRPALNIDAGERDDEPEALYELAHLVNVACGGHAGDEASMERVVRACLRAGTAVGAHPSYVDREGFGRRAMDVPAAAIERDVEGQCALLRRVAERCGARVVAMKLHGALYHAANERALVARACVAGARRALGDVAVLGPPNGALAEAASEGAGSFLREGFADRGVRPDGTLVPRGEPGALLTDPAACARRAQSLSSLVDTICVHGDTLGAVEIARAVRSALEAAADAHALR